MNKARLEWVMSGLIQHELTQSEGQFLKTTVADFNKKHGLTENQEKRLENLYKLKSLSTPKKKSDHLSSKKDGPKKTEFRRPRTKFL